MTEASTILDRSVVVPCTCRHRHAQRQTCKICGRPDKFDFHVSEKIWEAVVPPEFQTRVVCLYCFDDLAYERGVDYAPAVTKLYFAGDRACLLFRQADPATDRD